MAGARAFVQAPQTRFVRELFIETYDIFEEFEPGPDVPEAATGDEDYPPADHVLLRWPRLRQIRRFRYGGEEWDDYQENCWFRCEISGRHVYDFVKQMPDVEEVLVFAHFREARELLALRMPRLRILQLYHGQSYPLELLAGNPSLTHLTHLLCHPHALEPGDEPYIRLPQLRAVCRSPYLGALTHLRLRLTDFGDAGAKEIVESGVLKRLKVLDLRHGCVTDEGASLLAHCPDLRNLERLDLSRNALTGAGQEALLATNVSVDLGHQHSEVSGQDAEGRTSKYLYQGDWE